MEISSSTPPAIPARKAAELVRQRLPVGGLFADQEWRIGPKPFLLDAGIAEELESLGRVTLQFYRAVNLLYRSSVAGKQPAWVAELLDRGKPAALIELQRASAFKNEVPRVIRPDLLLTDTGVSLSELDSVPGGIGLTAWLNETYAALPPLRPEGVEVLDDGRFSRPDSNPHLIEAPGGMTKSFGRIFGDAPKVHIVISEESANYRPEMVWLANRLGNSRFQVREPGFTDFAEGDAVYRFFELFDLANVPSAGRIFDLAARKQIRLTPPPKPIFEEKLLLALLWNGNLRGFWRQELGQSFFERLLQIVPYTWVVDPTPLPPHGAIPELGLTDWQQLKTLSQRARDLILKVSGYSERAWGARGVYLGSDLSAGDWSAAIDLALASFEHAPFVLQRYHKPRSVDAEYFDFARAEVVPMKGRVRLCPYYFVTGSGDALRAELGGVLATICPADKKIIHGMKDAILAPSCAEGRVRNS